MKRRNIIGGILVTAISIITLVFGSLPTLECRTSDECVAVRRMIAAYSDNEHELLEVLDVKDVVLNLSEKQRRQLLFNNIRLLPELRRDNHFEGCISVSRDLKVHYIAFIPISRQYLESNICLTQDGYRVVEAQLETLGP